jgi:hypothetical protein
MWIMPFPDLQDVDVAGDGRTLLEDKRDREAERVGEVPHVGLGEVDRHLDRDGDRVVDEHELLDRLMALRVPRGGRDDEAGHFDRGVLALDDRDVREAEALLGLRRALRLGPEEVVRRVGIALV